LTLTLVHQLLQKGLEAAPELGVLYAANNRIGKVEDLEALKLCPRLSTLDLRNNKLETEGGLLELLQVVYFADSHEVYSKAVPHAALCRHYVDSRNNKTEEGLLELLQVGCDGGLCTISQLSERHFVLLQVTPERRVGTSKLGAAHACANGCRCGKGVAFF